MSRRPPSQQFGATRASRQANEPGRNLLYAGRKIASVPHESLGNTDVLDERPRMRVAAPDLRGVPAPVVRHGLRELGGAGRHIARVLMDRTHGRDVSDGERFVAKGREHVVAVGIQDTLCLGTLEDEQRVRAAVRCALDRARSDTLEAIWACRIDREG